MYECMHIVRKNAMNTMNTMNTNVIMNAAAHNFVMRTEETDKKEWKLSVT